jgi:hypothetical protein
MASEVKIVLLADGTSLRVVTGEAQSQFEKMGDSAKKAGDKASQGMDAASAGVTELRQRLDSMQDTVVNVGKAMATAFVVDKIVAMAKEAALLNARYETLGVAMTVVGKNAGYTGVQMEAAALGMQRMGISMVESRQQAMRLVQAHIDLADSQKLARIAQDAAVIGNMNSSDAFAAMIHGISTGQTDVLRTIGLNVSMEQSYKAMAETLHKHQDQLTQNERTQGVLNTVMKAGADIAGTYEAAMDTAGKQLNSMKRYTEDLKTVQGEVFNEVLTVAVMAYTSHLKESNEEMRAMAASGELKAWGMELAAVFVGVANAIDNIMTGAKMVGTWLAQRNVAGDITDKYQQKMDALGNSPDVWQQRGDLVAKRDAEIKGSLQQLDDANVELGKRHDRFQNAWDARQQAIADKAAKSLAATVASEAERARIMAVYTEQRDQGLLSMANYVKVMNAFAQASYGDNHQYKDAAPIAKVEKGPASAYDGLNDSIGRNLQMANEELLMGDKLSAADKQRTQDIGKVTDAFIAKKITENQWIKLATDAEAAAEARRDATASNYLAALQKETSQVGLTAEQIKMLAAAKEAAASPRYANQIMAEALALAIATDTHAAAESTRKEMLKLGTDLVNLGDSSVKKLTEEIDKQREHNAEIGLTKDQIAELIKAKDVLSAATDEELAGNMRLAANSGAAGALHDYYLQYAKDLDALAAKKRELAGLKVDGAALETADAAAKKAAEEWKKTADSIASSLTDALMRGFESGKSFAENFRGTVVNMFKTLVLRPIVSAIVSPVAGGITALMGGGAAQAADGTMGAVNGLSGMGSMAQGISSLSGMGAWMTNFGDSATQALYKAGEAAYKMGFEKIGGSVMDGIGSAGGFSAVSSGLQVVGNGLGYLSAALAASEGKWGQAIGTGIGTYFGGPIGAAIGSWVGSAVDNAFGGGHEYTVGSGISGKVSSTGTTGRNYQDWKNDGSSGFFGIGGASASSGRNYSALDSGATQAIGSAYNAINAQTLVFAAALGMSGDSIKNYSQDFSLAMGADAKANQVALAAMVKGAANAAAATALEAQYAQAGEDATTTLARLAVSLAAVNGNFTTLDKTLMGLSQANGAAASALVTLMGGLSAYQASMSTYYQTYYTEAERNAKTLGALQQSFAALNLTLPDTLEGYRNLVNAQDVSTESGRSAYAALASMSGAFATVTGAATQAASAITQAFSDSLKTLQDSLAGARTAVASAKDQIDPKAARSARAIGADVAVATTNSSLSAMVAVLNAQGAAVTAQKDAAARLEAAKSNVAYAMNWRDGQKAILNNVVSESATYVQKTIQNATDLHAVANTYGAHGQGIKLSSVWAPYSDQLNNDAYNYNAGTNRVSGYAAYGGNSWTDRQSWWEGGNSTTYTANTAGMLQDSRYQALNSALSGANSTLAYNEQRVEGQKGVVAWGDSYVAGNQAIQTTRTAEKAAADLAAKAAQTAYTAAANAWVVQANKSVPALTKLREETQKYYDQQKALADTMTTSAANLRAAVQSTRQGQLDSAQSLAQRQAAFTTAYSMALSTTGTMQAGYADKLTATLPDLSAALMDTASSRTEWALATAQLVAQSTAIANQLDASAPKDYQADSLALLDSIDSALFMLDDNTKAITRAIADGSSVTAEGLRQVVRSLGGTPAFASGGDHAGGLRMVGENGPELEVTGPSRIFSASQTRGMLGRGGGASYEEMVAELRELRAELRAGQAAIASNTDKTAKILRRVTPNGNSLQMVVEV